MAKKNYKIDNAHRTITADLTKVTPAEKEIIDTHVALGYTFVSKVVTRDGSKRKRSYFENQLIASDYEIFNEIANKLGTDGKKKRGAYSDAVSFASTIIKLGKYVDDHKDESEILDLYRELALSDKVEARLFAQDYIAA